LFIQKKNIYIEKKKKTNLQSIRKKKKKNRKKFAEDIALIKEKTKEPIPVAALNQRDRR
jgi:hypothetical protein